MAIGDHREIVWPFALDGDLVFSDDAIGTTTTVESFSATYITQEAGASVPPGLVNLADAVAAILKSAYAAVVGPSATWSVEPTDAGKFRIANPNASPLWVLPGHVSTTIDPAALGLDAATPLEFDAGGTAVTPYQVAGQWLPSRPHVDDTGERVRHVIVQGPPTATGVRSVVCHSDAANPAYYRTIEWDDIHHARMFQSAADDAVAAAIAGVAEGDPNVPFESLVRYWIDNTQPFPQRVYVRARANSTVLDGPYQLSLPDAAATDGGVARAWQRNDLSQRRFRAILEFVREGGS